MNKGICCAGYMCVDSMYYVSEYPKKSELAHVVPPIENATGGSVCNTGLDIAILDPSVKMQACGVIGEDLYGDLMTHTLGKYPNVDTSMIIKKETSAFSIVMNDLSDRTRTFFECEGPYADFCENDIAFDKLDADIFHIGYLLLMPALDADDPEYGTKMARLLHRVQQMGVRTSIDVISEAGEEAAKRFRKIVTPALKHTNYCVINELEAQNITGVLLRDEDETLHVENFKAALEKLKELGVSTWAVIHCPEIGAGLDENNNYFEFKSLQLPKGYIKGSTGAGDAFCAGVLYAAEKELGMAEALKIGACTAAASLSEVGSIEGVRPLAEVLKLYDQYGK
mgnify:CR=1 FL=1